MIGITPEDFKTKSVLGNIQMPEFQITDEYEVELEGWDDIPEEEMSYDFENSVWPLQY